MHLDALDKAINDIHKTAHSAYYGVPVEPKNTVVADIIGCLFILCLAAFCFISVGLVALALR